MNLVVFLPPFVCLEGRVCEIKYKCAPSLCLSIGLKSCGERGVFVLSGKNCGGRLKEKKRGSGRCRSKLASTETKFCSGIFLVFAVLHSKLHNCVVNFQLNNKGLTLNRSYKTMWNFCLACLLILLGIRLAPSLICLFNLKANFDRLSINISFWKEVCIKQKIVTIKVHQFLTWNVNCPCLLNFFLPLLQAVS